MKLKIFDDKRIEDYKITWFRAAYNYNSKEGKNNLSIVFRKDGVRHCILFNSKEVDTIENYIRILKYKNARMEGVTNAD